MLFVRLLRLLFRALFRGNCSVVTPRAPGYQQNDWHRPRDTEVARVIEELDRIDRQRSMN